MEMRGDAAPRAPETSPRTDRFRAVAPALLLLAGCVAATGTSPAVAPAAPGSAGTARAVAGFRALADPRPGALGLSLSEVPAAPAATTTIVPEASSGVTLSSANVALGGDGCGPGSNTFEGDVTITNHGATALRNVYAEILSMSEGGRESCNSSAVPRPGSSDVSATHGLWAYGDLPAGGSRTVRWRFPTPNSTPYTFTGRVITAGELSSFGAGSGQGATIDEVLVDSDGASLYVTVAFSSVPAGHHLFLLVDDLNRASGMTSFSYDPTGTASALSGSAATLANPLNVDPDYYEVGAFGPNGTLTRTSQRTITGPSSSTAAAGTQMTQDPAAGRYHFAIPYAAIGAAPADRVQVYALFGEPNQGNQGGIHSAAPAPPAAQVDRMNLATGSGLAALSPSPPSHVLVELASGCPPTLHVAVIGDYGYAGTENGLEEARVAALVKEWRPDLIITLGDNDYDYSQLTTDDNVGQFYAAWIGNYHGAYGPGAATNAFFPSMGNHDWVSRGRTDGKFYLDYFTLPGNERYYDVTFGDLHLFALDSNSQEPDGRTASSVQGRWLQGRLASSTARWKLVYFHHPPYTSGTTNGPTAAMAWPFASWGASVVLSGHEHNYERLAVDGIPYFVNGLGGDVIYPFGTSADPHSQFRYAQAHAAQRIVSNGSTLRLDLVNVARAPIDSRVIASPSPCVR